MTDLIEKIPNIKITNAINNPKNKITRGSFLITDWKKVCEELKIPLTLSENVRSYAKRKLNYSQTNKMIEYDNVRRSKIISKTRDSTNTLANTPTNYSSENNINKPKLSINKIINSEVSNGKPCGLRKPVEAKINLDKARITINNSNMSKNINENKIEKVDEIENGKIIVNTITSKLGNMNSMTKKVTEAGKNEVKIDKVVIEDKELIVDSVNINKLKLDDEYLGIRYESSLHRDLLLPLAYKNRKKHGKVTQTNWLAVCRDLKISTTENRIVSREAGKLGYKPSLTLVEINKLLENVGKDSIIVNENDSGIMNKQENSNLMVESQPDTTSTPTSQIVEKITNLSKSKNISKIKLFPLGETTLAEKIIISKYNTALGSLLEFESDCPNFEKQFLLIKTCAYLLQQEIDDNRKQINKNNKRKVNRKKSQLELYKAIVKSLNTNNNSRNTKDRVRIRRAQKNFRIHKLTDLLNYLSHEIEELELEMNRLTKKIEYAKLLTEFNNKPSLRTIRKLTSTNTPNNTELDSNEALDFYSNLYSPINTNETLKIDNVLTEFLDVAKDELDNIPKILTPTRDEIDFLIDKKANWKAVGPDGIHSMWYKLLPAAKKVVADWIINIWEGNTNILNTNDTEGNLHLIFKEGDPTDPSNYRPITCLNHKYKLLTASIYEKLGPLLTDTLIFPIEQKALKRGRQGCTDALVKDALIILNDKINNRLRTKNELHVTWIDFKKAFDSIDHRWLIKIINILPLPESTINSLSSLTKSWKSTIIFNKKRIGSFKIGRGVPQGDSLSPLLFCMSIAGIGYGLNKVEGFKSTLPLTSNHQWYMDDLKMYANSAEYQKLQINTLTRLSNNIGLDINNKKCATYNNVNINSPILDFPLITKNETYKYLGITQNDLTDLTTLETKLTNKVLTFLNEVISKNLPLRLTTKLIANTLKPAIEYLATNMIFTGSRNQGINIGKQLDKLIRRRLTQSHDISLTSLISRLYLPRNLGGRGLTKLEDVFTNGMINLGLYAYSSTDPETNKIAHYLANKYDPLTQDNRLRTPIGDAIAQLTNLGITTNVERQSNRIRITINNEEVTLRKVKDLVKNKLLNNNMKALTNSKYYEITNRYKLSKLSNKFLTTNTNSSLEQLICHAQERQLFFDTKHCRFGCTNRETLEHVLTSCIHKDTIGRVRHDNVLKIITNVILTRIGERKLSYNEKLYSVPSKNLYIDWPWKESQVKSHKPDLVYLPENATKPLILLDVAIANIDNITNQEKWKEVKYCTNSNIEYTDNWELTDNNLANYLQNKFNRKVEFVSVVIGPLGEILEDSINNINKKLELNTKEANKLWTNINISVTRDSYRLLKQHFGKNNH
uniref:Reverse transcriptase domain-containing protein n=1 Tax=Strongyloides papillosus TaxID=174720 RepID=A0A0N5BJJ2_STREA